MTLIEKINYGITEAIRGGRTLIVSPTYRIIIEPNDPPIINGDKIKYLHIEETEDSK